MRFHLAGAAVALLTITLAGCGGKHGAKVSGTVSLDGEPLPTGCVGTVAFIPTGGGPPATGMIDDSSGYRLSTGRDKTLPPGDYNVTVGANEAPSVASGPNGGPPPPGKPVTPARYRQARTSGLNFTVESGSNTIDIELTSSN